MKNRLLFGFLVTLMLGLSGFAIYRIFFVNSDQLPSSPKAEKAKIQNSKEGTGSTEKGTSREEGRSIWADPRLRGLSGTGSTGDTEKAKEIESNLKNLVGLYDRGEDKDFLAKLDQLIAANPDAKEYLALKGDYYFNEGKWPEAEQTVRSLITKDPENMFARTTLAEILAAQGKMDEALSTQQEVIQKNPGYGDALNGILAVTEMQGKPEKGEEIVRNNAMANLSNGNAVAPYLDVLRAQEKTEELRKLTQESLKLDPTNPELLQREAINLIQQGKSQEAIAAADQAANFSPNPTNKIVALNVKYQAAYSTRNLPIMEQVIEEIKAIDPEHETLARLQDTIEMLKKN
jgi:tetratricopeptide (TPR) repeat protein